jgi:uncharacterized cupredoxin-like copper-binding protein
MNMKFSIAVLALAPLFAVAAGNHAGHDMGAMHHDMSGMHADAEESYAGKAGDPAKVSRSIEITMDDSMRFTPSQISVKAGETVRFFVKNSGKVQHEMVIGTTAELQEHAEMMRKMPGMQHADANMIALAPSKRGGMVWQFTKAGRYEFACLIPGHLEAGMKGVINVE